MRLIAHLVRMARAALTLLLWAYAFVLMGYLGLRAVVGDGLWWLSWLNNFAPYYFLPLIFTLPLSFALRLKRSALVHGFLALVATIWLLPRFLDTPFQRVARLNESERALTVVTFNIRGDNPQLDSFFSWLRSTNADIVLLQETPASWTHDGIPQLLDPYPYQVSLPIGAGQWGEVILSRQPIVGHERYRVQGFPHDRIEIEWAGERIAIYNVHMVIPQRATARLTQRFYRNYLNMILKYDDSIRNDQIDELLALLANERLPFIAAGDFNTSDNAVAYERIAARLRDSFREGGRGMGSTWPHARVAGLPSFIPPLIRIDYVWHSDEFQTLTTFVGPPLGSDHLPVIANLVLRESP